MALVTALVGVLLLVAALVVWQHRGRRRGELVYGTEDAVTFVLDKIGPDLFRQVGETGVRRILEYQLLYLQGLAQASRRHPVDVVAGAYQPAVEYIADEISTHHGREYPESVISAVFALGADYLASIGAIGEQVEGNQN